MSIRTFMKKFLLIAVAVALVFTVPADSALSASVISVASTPSQEEIVEYAQNYPSDLVSYSDWGFPQNGYTIGFRIKPQLSLPYASGALSDEELICALNTIKTIRYIAGLSDAVYLSDEYNSLAQASSLVNYVNDELTHTPAAPAGMDSSLAKAGYTGATKSNLAWASW